VVLSSHDFDGMPTDLHGQARAMVSTGAGVAKIAVKASGLTDCTTLLDLSRTFAPAQQFVLIAMGDAGLPTRVLAQRFGSAWTYAGQLGDIGQVTARLLLEQFRFRSIGPSTGIYGLTGYPIGHSVSPAMHNAAFGATGIDGVYLPLPAANVEDFIAFARAFGVKGASVTIPHKVALFDKVDEVDDLSRAVGALNTIRVEGERWKARNTDVAGFLQPLRARQILRRGLRASVVGAGGSARAVAIGLASEGAIVTVHARDAAKAAVVAGLVGGSVGSYPPAAGSWDLLVNCTPVGMQPRIDASPLPEDGFGPGVVYDLIYNPAVTRLMADAARAGCDTIGGLDMLVGQAQEQFAWWTGVQPPAGVMRAAAEARLSEFKTP
jgi:shikimate dehydrogenase